MIVGDDCADSAAADMQVCDANEESRWGLAAEAQDRLREAASDSVPCIGRGLFPNGRRGEVESSLTGPSSPRQGVD